MGTTEQTPATLSDEEAGQRDAFVDRLFSAFLASADLLTVYIGDALGLHRSLAHEGPATSEQLATRAGLAERYAREWLEQQAVTGILRVDDASQAAAHRSYALPRAHAEPLTELDSLNSIVPLARLLPPAMAVMPKLLEAYRSGGGVSWAEYGDDLWQSQGDFNRPLFRNQLTQEILPQIADVHAKLGEGARVADIACGVGWSSIAIARGYPRTRVDGFDLDERAVATARRAAAEAGVADRVDFHIRDATDPAHNGRYDLVTIFEAVARLLASGRDAPRRAPDAGGGRLGARDGRARGGVLHCTSGRHRATHVRRVDPHLPAERPRQAAGRRDRHGHAPRHAA